MKSVCCFEKGFALLCFLQTSETEPGETQLEFIIAMPSAGLLLLFWGL